MDNLVNQRPALHIYYFKLWRYANLEETTEGGESGTTFRKGSRKSGEGRDRKCILL